MQRIPPIGTTPHGDIFFTDDERQKHLVLFGKSGSGKSTVLFNLAMADILAGQGVIFLDPHGDTAEAIIDAMPRHRVHDVCYFNVADAEYPVGFNPLAGITPARRALAASGIVSTFAHLWGDSFGPRLTHFLFNATAALLESPHTTLLDISLMFTDERFRDRVVASVTDPIVGRFWREEYPSYDRNFSSEAASPVLNKVGQFAASPIVRNILGQHTPKFDLQYAMDNRQIVIANLSKGHIGETASNLLGSLLISHLQLLTMARAELPAANRSPVYVHVDEAANFTTDAFASLLSEARKYRTHFVLGTQYTSALRPEVRDAILGNVGTLMIFRVSAADAEILAPEFHPLPPNELVDQWPYRAWLRRIDNNQYPIELAPPAHPPRHALERVISTSRRKFARRRDQIERSFY
jgi:TraM recognition site of TraD and TraG